SRRSSSSLLGQRHIDETAYASRLECKFHLAIEVMAEAALHQPSAETTARRRDHAGAAGFPPFQAQATLAGAPADRDLPFRHRKRAVLERVGAQLVQRHRERERWPRAKPHRRAVDPEALQPMAHA